MWMCYAEQSWTKAVDKFSAAERLIDEFTALEFDASHEAVYGKAGYSAEYCEALENKYKRGLEICREFIEGKSCGSCFVRKLVAADLKEYITCYSRFFPEGISDDKSEK